MVFHDVAPACNTACVYVIVHEFGDCDGLSYLASKSCVRSLSSVYNHRLRHAVGT